MTGAEWFATTPGGLNRYFTDLFQSLQARPDTRVSASAFGNAAAGGHSWGPSCGSTVARVWTSLRDDRGLSSSTVVDRHFSLFGRPALGRRGRLPSVAHFHGPWAAESAASGESPAAVRAKYWVERLRFLDIDRFVVLSEHSARLLRTDYGVDADRIRVIAPGVDLARFTVPAQRRSDRPTVLCVRRLENRMGIDRLIAAWPAVASAHPDARLLVVGEGTQESALRALAASSPASSSIEFLGRVDDARLRSLYAAATVSVVPTVALEGFGLIALESCAVGCPPVVTDCGGLPDAVAGLDPSLIVPAGDSDALAARLTTALDGVVPGAEACRAHAERFSWDSAAAEHVELYREVAS
ncbi:glycosyltransferase family 4 protein [Rhodococcoides kroppenstedtii]|uniref:glycosyltransferase family 4 protein n=1 Tax=Rhodococcoides kroppenstedtii TaxID=293050 RepID=UPI003626715F